ncbi:MAG: PHP domain-containing protein [Lachnospiraceae bacterium]|nr:PHP domain-containing protein [Lachnospiraceae bacterium]
METRKFDMHVHTMEGSPDSSVSIMECVKILKEKGYGGMLVTDHNSYKGYEAMTFSEKQNLGDFVVLRGIEYDTFGSGHMLIIMPEGKIPKGLYHRGLPLATVLRIVHENGGIIGPAHPCGEPFLSFYSTGFWFKQKDLRSKIMEEFDFLEGYNACEVPDNNLKARKAAAFYKKPMTAGSDSHKADCVGLGWTDLPSDIKCEDDLIRYIKTKPDIYIGGRFYGKSTKEKLGKANHFLVYGFFYYNKAQNLAHQLIRVAKRHNNFDPGEKL